MNVKSIGLLLKKFFNLTLLKETYQHWSKDKASRLAAALAYYTATAIAPLLVGVLAIVGFLFSREQAQEQLVAQVQANVGAQGAEVVQTILANADQPDLARLAGLLSLVALLWSASNIFVQLQESLDTIWGVELRTDLPLLSKVKHRLFPLLVVFGIGVLLLVALVANTALSAIGGLVSDLLPGGALIWQVVNFFISLAIITLLFGIVLKVLPDVEIAWSDVWPGSLLTALLFVIGQFALGWYLGRQSGASLYGAAGSLIILLLWIYYSAQIFLFGAEYTQVYATRYGQGVLPAKDAVVRQAEGQLKPVAQAVGKGAHAEPYTGNRIKTANLARAWQQASAPWDALPLPQLLVSLGHDGRTLFRQEIRLAQAEMRELLQRVTRGVVLLAGGGLLLYGGALILLAAVPLLLWALLAMPLWLAVLLVGLLLVIEGWILTIGARRKLANLARAPKRSAASVREDIEVVKGHLAS